MEGRAIFFIYVRKCENHQQQILPGLWNHNADVLPAYVPVHSKTAQVNPPPPTPTPGGKPSGIWLLKKIG